MTAPVPSRLPSFTRMISPGTNPRPIAWLILLTRIGRFFSSLKQGTMTLNVAPGDSPAPTRSLAADSRSTAPPAARECIPYHRSLTLRRGSRTIRPAHVWYAGDADGTPSPPPHQDPRDRPLFCRPGPHRAILRGRPRDATSQPRAGPQPLFAGRIERFSPLQCGVFQEREPPVPRGHRPRPYLLPGPS